MYGERRGRQTRRQPGVETRRNCRFRGFESFQSCVCRRDPVPGAGVVSMTAQPELAGAARMTSGGLCSSRGWSAEDSTRRGVRCGGSGPNRPVPLTYPRPAPIFCTNLRTAFDLSNQGCQKGQPVLRARRRRTPVTACQPSPLSRHPARHRGVPVAAAPMRNPRRLGR